MKLIKFENNWRWSWKSIYIIELVEKYRSVWHFFQNKGNSDWWSLAFWSLLDFLVNFPFLSALHVHRNLDTVSIAFSTSLEIILSPFCLANFKAENWKITNIQYLSHPNNKDTIMSFWSTYHVQLVHLCHLPLTHLKKLLSNGWV